jgi:DNA-binding MarR family transcriptional regulator
LDLLVEKGLVRRQMADDDRRKFNIYLTEEGEILHQNALSVIGEIRRKSWGNLTDEDYEHLVRIMDKIHENVSEK